MQGITGIKRSIVQEEQDFAAHLQAVHFQTIVTHHITGIQRHIVDILAQDTKALHNAQLRKLARIGGRLHRAVVRH